MHGLHGQIMPVRYTQTPFHCVLERGPERASEEFPHMILNEI